jgi:hypothetical protein
MLLAPSHTYARCNRSCTIFTRDLCGKMKSNQGNQTNYGSKKEEGDTEEGRSTRQGKGKAEDQEFCKEIHEEFQAKGWQEEGRKTPGVRGDAQTANEAGFTEAQR